MSLSENFWVVHDEVQINDTGDGMHLKIQLTSASALECFGSDCSRNDNLAHNLLRRGRSECPLEDDFGAVRETAISVVCCMSAGFSILKSNVETPMPLVLLQWDECLVSPSTSSPAQSFSYLESFVVDIMIGLCLFLFNQTAVITIRLFKMAFGAVTSFPVPNEPILAAHLAKLIIQDLPLVAKASKSTNYYHLLRGLFRAIGGGGGRYELLYKEVLPLLPESLTGMSELLDTTVAVEVVLSVSVCNDVVGWSHLLAPTLGQHHLVGLAATCLHPDQREPFPLFLELSRKVSGSPQAQESSLCILTSLHARAKRRIAVLEEEVEILKQDKVTKQRKTTYYVSQGRAIRRMVALYTPIEDLIAENDRPCEDGDNDTTIEQDRHQHGYIELSKTATMDSPEADKSGPRGLKRGADSAHGDDMGTLKELVASWVNIDCHPTPLIRTDDKHHRGFINDACGRMLCPAEWHWDDPVIRAGIRDRTMAYIVSENSWPLFMYEGYEASVKNLERGLMKSKLLVMVRFALSNITSWRTVDADFDYQLFWNNIPGPATRARVHALLEWWTRKVFGRNHQQDLTLDVISQMSVSALAAQRLEMEAAAFDSD
ncbi:uncharacterized protein F5891DRAFT_982453 [Suillus fuscotomentosus]|uniref:Uncharacterized protein n=1 Tax=Suillus fuscotomentosus TaxID=1912939 RepID=A0AAD4E1P7_9AGAM|nr:uncharacterized protein F5891DRAFT_982453 [Suillus fuscotomentosus]KAG1897722.1 hypothetical protein F5891DRAFT_982453 [Suillus fuscotomentosus]